MYEKFSWHRASTASHNTTEVVLHETAVFYYDFDSGASGGSGPWSGDYIKWVDFNVSYEAMDKALALDIRSQEQDMPVSWIDLLALAACRTGGR